LAAATVVVTLAAMVAVILPAGVTADTSGTAVGMATA